MALPWVRLDSNIYAHDKILHLLSDPSPKRFQAAASYMFALAWAGGTGTDGLVFAAVLPLVHGNPATARLLVKYRLWTETPTGFQIHNFDTRQELSTITAMKRAAQSAGAKKANCRRFHGPDCHCWKGDLNAG
jgi:hypothetical protein